MTYAGVRTGRVGRQMRVPMTVADFLDRAEAGFADSPGVIDEPGQPAAPVAPSTYRRLGERVRAWQAGLDALGVGEGERVAVVSHNSARLLELLFAVPMSGRICVPVNFRLKAEEIERFRPLLPVGYATVAAAYAQAAAEITAQDLTDHYTTGLGWFREQFVPQLKSRLSWLTADEWSSSRSRCGA